MSAQTFTRHINLTNINVDISATLTLPKTVSLCNVSIESDGIVRGIHELQKCDNSDFRGLVAGCTNPTAQNFNPMEQIDDGTCGPSLPFGCYYTIAVNYDSSARGNDGSCVLASNHKLGCTCPTARNYNPSSTLDDGTCVSSTFGCIYPNAEVC